MRPLSPRERRGLAILIALAVLTVAWLGVVSPYLEGFSDRAQARALLAERYAANARLIAAVPRLVREAARRDAKLDRFVLPTADPAVGADLLRTRISAATTAVGGDFRGTEDGPAVPGKATLHATMRMSAEQVQRLIATLENTRPYLAVTGLTIGADNALQTGNPGALDIAIDLAAPLRTNGTPPAKATRP